MDVLNERVAGLENQLRDLKDNMHEYLAIAIMKEIKKPLEESGMSQQTRDNFKRLFDIE